MAHLLANPWTFYYYLKPRGNPHNRNVDYGKCIQRVAKVSSVEEFWAVYSRLIRPETLKIGAALHFFRDDSRAMWEDEENEQGGTFMIQLPKGHASPAWEKLLLDFIGGQIHSDIIGAVISLRQENDRLIIWNRTSNNQELLFHQCAQIFKSLELPLKSKVEYMAHPSPKNGRSKATTYVYEVDGPVIVPNDKPQSHT